MPDKPQSQPAPDDASAIPVPGEWTCVALDDGFLTLESPLSVIDVEAPEIISRLKVGEIYHLTLSPAWVTVATSDQPKAS